MRIESSFTTSFKKSWTFTARTRERRSTSWCARSRKLHDPKTFSRAKKRVAPGAIVSSQTKVNQIRAWMISEAAILNFISDNLYEADAQPGRSARRQRGSSASGADSLVVQASRREGVAGIEARLHRKI